MTPGLAVLVMMLGRCVQVRVLILVNDDANPEEPELLTLSTIRPLVELGVCPVHNQLLCFAYIEMEVVVLAQLSQL